MSLIEVVLDGVILGGLYALIAIGFNLQYGVARIFNLAYGEFLMAAAFAAFWMFTLAQIDPILGMLVSVPVTFAANWLVYRVLMLPLVRRAPDPRRPRRRDHPRHLRLLFVLKGWHSSRSRRTSASTVSQRAGADLGLHLRGQPGARLRRRLRVRARHLARPDPHPLRLGDARARHRADRRPPGRRSTTNAMSALAFASGGALVAVAGTLVSTFLSFKPATASNTR